MARRAATLSYNILQRDSHPQEDLNLNYLCVVIRAKMAYVTGFTERNHGDTYIAKASTIERPASGTGTRSQQNADKTESKGTVDTL